MHDLEGVAGCDVHLPERAAHGHRDAVAAGVPRATWGTRATRRGPGGREMEVVHVVSPMCGGGVGAPWLGGDYIQWLTDWGWPVAEGEAGGGRDARGLSLGRSDFL